MNISPHFTLEELLKSPTATRLGFDEQFSPPDSIKQNLTALCENVLEPLRAKLGKPITITSGYRCERDNAAIGGAKNSQHVLGQAADIFVEGMSVEELFEFINNSGIPFQQHIQEFSQWNHISYNPIGEQKNEKLRAIKVDGQTKYIPA